MRRELFVQADEQIRDTARLLEERGWPDMAFRLRSVSPLVCSADLEAAVAELQMVRQVVCGDSESYEKRSRP